MTIVVIGGTAEGRELAERLHDAGEQVLTSLAGRTSEPALVPGDLRVGGFGGAEPMARWLMMTEARAVVDATHPFAAKMTGNTLEAARLAKVPLLRLNRPSWRGHTLADSWEWVADDAAAVAAAQQTAGAILLTIGRQHVHAYRDLSGRRVFARMTEPGGMELPDGFTPVVERGPFTIESECSTFVEHGVRVLISKDSGGEATEAKLVVAHQVAAHVIMIERPPGPEGMDEVGSVAGALEWLQGLGD